MALQDERFAVDSPLYYIERKNVKSDGRFPSRGKKNQCVEYSSSNAMAFNAGPCS